MITYNKIILKIMLLRNVAKVAKQKEMRDLRHKW